MLTRPELTRGLGGDAETVPAAPIPGVRARARSSFEPSLISEQLGSYRILEEVGRGGMGTVYRAIRDDQEYESEVAIKVVSLGSNSTFLLERLRTERQILAVLEHPNIARLIDGGRSPDGRPYFVMEFVRGEKLTDYCENRELPIRDRIALFRGICEAVSYAHQHLIVHRDLKPENILVTDEGTPKLLDFGIAKMLQHQVSGEEPERTQTLVQMATPAYSSPEQIRGTPVGVASDIYSLGVILYELLTGQRPYRLTKTWEESARIICEREPTRPSVAVGNADTVSPDTREILRRQLAGDLDTILAVALHKEPERRYRSVAHFSEDLQRHLDGLPVSARNDTFFYRSSKFISRNKFATALGSGAFVLLCCSGIFAGWQAHQLSLRVDEDRKLASSFLVNMHDEIAKLPGATPAREALLVKSLEYLNGLAKYRSSDPDMQRSLASTYERFADLQAGAGGAGFGKSWEALRTYESARAIREHLAESKSLLAEDELLRNYLLGTYIAGLAGRTDLRNVFDSKALELARSLAQGDPADLEYAGLLAKAYTNTAYGQALRGDTASAMSNYLLAMQIRERLDGHYLSPDSKRDLANVYYRIGALQVQVGQPRQALVNLQRAAALQQDVVGPSELAGTQYFMCVALAQTGELGEAVQQCDSAIKLREPLLAADPLNGREKGLLAGLYAERATLLLKLHRPAAAEQNGTRAVALERDLVRSDPNATPTRMALAGFEADLARAQDSLKHWQEASKTWSEAAALYSSVHRNGAPEKAASEAREAQLHAIQMAASKRNVSR